MFYFFAVVEMLAASQLKHSLRLDATRLDIQNQINQLIITILALLHAIPRIVSLIPARTDHLSSKVRVYMTREVDDDVMTESYAYAHKLRGYLRGATKLNEKTRYSERAEQKKKILIYIHFECIKWARRTWCKRCKILIGTNQVHLAMSEWWILARFDGQVVENISYFVVPCYFEFVCILILFLIFFFEWQGLINFCIFLFHFRIVT